MQSPPKSLKTFCNRVAEAAFSEDGMRFARLLRIMGLLGEPFHPVAGPAEGARPSDTSANTDRVGIWERKSENGMTYFGRRLDMLKDWNYWANLGRIEPRGDKRRVVLIGESVARGYLYDPLFTPAMVLEAILEGQMGKGQVEVIDLARTNLGLEVEELAMSALQLEPDAVIIFSGNNWSASFPPQISEIACIDTLLREQGIAGLKLFTEEQLAGKVERLVRTVSSFYEEKGVPLVWLLPEFNLGDWRDPITNAPQLPGTANREWIGELQAARRAFDLGDLGEAARRAEKMIELDQGVSIAGLYILAECSQRAGDLEAARRYLEMARDTVIWDPSRSTSPRMYGVAQQALRRTAAKHACELVDIPQVFREYLDGGIPDRRLFLDYCHLTADGIRVAMAAAAEPVVKLLGGADVPWRGLVDENLAPSREVEAEAAFLAAVHNAHWWQSFDLVRYYCSQSLQAGPAIAEVMTRFVDIQNRQTPMLMCRAAEEIMGLGSPLIQHYLLRYNNQQLDSLLLCAVASALKDTGIDISEQLAQLRDEEHSVRHADTNLLDYYYGSSGLQPQEVMWVVPHWDGYVLAKENHFYKAYWLESHFAFVGDAGRPALLSLTCRLPGAVEEAITVEVNGHPQVEIVIGRDWQTWDLTVPGEAVAEGLNKVVIHWPLPEFAQQKVLAAVSDNLIDGIFPEFFCSFGEIHSFVAVDGGKAEALLAAVEQSSAVEGVG
jgi:hypothetical protein